MGALKFKRDEEIVVPMKNIVNIDDYKRKKKLKQFLSKSDKYRGQLIGAGVVVILITAVFVYNMVTYLK